MRFYGAAVSPHGRSSLSLLSRRGLGAGLPRLVRRWEQAYARRGPLVWRLRQV